MGDSNHGSSLWVTPPGKPCHGQLPPPIPPADRPASSPTLDTPLQRTVTFTPAANVFGANAASFAVRARDQWNGTSPAATVAVSLAPMSDAPTLAVQTRPGASFFSKL